MEGVAREGRSAGDPLSDSELVCLRFTELSP